MKIIITLIILLLAIGSCKSQVNYSLEREKNFKYSNALFLDSLGINKPNFKLIDIEIRVWHNHVKSGDYTLLQLNKNSAGIWKGKNIRFYYYNSSSYDFRLNESMVKFSDKWKDSWNMILQKNYLNIPHQEIVDKKIRKQIPDDIILVADGENYIVEVLTKKRKRKFSYINPHKYYSFYKEKNVVSSDYLNFIDLISILKQELE